MTNIKDHFGIEVILSDSIDRATYQLIADALQARIASQSIPESARIYIKKMDMIIWDDHCGMRGVSNRLSNLDVTVEIGPRKRNKFRFLDLNVQVNPSINVIRRDEVIMYSLSGAYIAQAHNYSDYIAILVEKNVTGKNLQVILHAHATPAYLPHLKGLKGGVTSTEIPFLLTENIQFRMF